MGIDISGAMIATAKDRVPLARFEQVDIRAFAPPPASFDAATVYFSFIAGMTQADIRASLVKVHSFLKPGGVFVFSTVPMPAEWLQIRWMGRPVVVSSLSPEEAVEAVKEAGFAVEHEQLSKFTPKAVEAGICQTEEVWEETHLFVYARKPAVA